MERLLAGLQAPLESDVRRPSPDPVTDRAEAARVAVSAPPEEQRAAAPTPRDAPRAVAVAPSTPLGLTWSAGQRRVGTGTAAMVLTAATAAAAAALLLAQHGDLFVP